MLYNNQLYLMDSEPELEQRYGDSSTSLTTSLLISLSKVTKEKEDNRR